jgi:cation diffusion facilitator CzcD-associated flavoprotein CzcO
MTALAAHTPIDEVGPASAYDVLIVGAGMSGIYQLYRLRALGMRVRVLEAGTGVGGTWYWNRYPGARFDSESYSYGYSFSDEVLQEWNWSEHFSAQPETERYINFVADKFDLKRDIEFKTRVVAAHWQDRSASWLLTSEDGRRWQSAFLITAIGPLSAPTLPRIKRVDTFQGEAYHTGLWPKHDVTFEGKRVAVIGTGATGVQTTTEVAKTVKHLTVFQRRPNWCKPLHNRKIVGSRHGARHPLSGRAGVRWPGLHGAQVARCGQRARRRSRRRSRPVIRHSSSSARIASPAFCTRSIRLTLST